MPVTWPTYTAPPVPTATSDAATWANYLAHVRITDDRLRFDAQQLLTEASTAAQNARAEAEQAVAAAGQANAAALKASAEAVASMPAGVTEATLLEAIKTVAARE